MSKIAHRRTARAALALVATLIAAAPAFAGAQIKPVSARMTAGTPLNEAYALFQPAEARLASAAAPAKVSMLQRCTRSGARMVC